MGFVQKHLDEAGRILAQLDVAAIENMAALLADLRARGGRLFLLGSGGGAGGSAITNWTMRTSSLG